MSELTILCPITSRGCSEASNQQPIFHALLPSMDALQMWGGCRVILGYDDDDPLWGNPIVRDRVTHPVEWHRLRGVTGQITTIWNSLAAAAAGARYVLPANDDLAFRTSPLPAIETLKQRSDFGLVGFDDGAFPNLATFFVVGRPHFKIFRELYPVPWQGAHQDSWIADVYRPWGASEIERTIQVHNRIGSGKRPVTAARFEYGTAPGYQAAVASGRHQINVWLGQNPGIAPMLPPGQLQEARTILD